MGWEFMGNEYLNGKEWNGKVYKEDMKYEIKYGKDYFRDILFEGEYLNGGKNGKGKEFYSDSDETLLFEGIYKYGKREGKGKEYGINCKIKFEEEYSNGKGNGKGKEMIVLVI